MVRFRAAALALAMASIGLSARGAEILLLDFWSPACGPCMQMKPLIQSFVQANYPIREIDTSRNPETPRQFNVDRWPCFVMLVDGQEVDRHLGPATSQQLQEMFQKAKDIAVQRSNIRGQSPDASSPAAGAPAGQNSARGPAPRLDNAPVPQRDPWGQSAESTRGVPIEQGAPQAALPVAPERTANSHKV